MNFLSIAIAIFVVLELLNVFMLYFMPGTKRGNGMGVFNAYEKSKSDPDIHALVRYLINWVAGTKLIFIGLLSVILFTGDDTSKILSAAVLILSILTFFWRLYPAIRLMDEGNQLTPRGYSGTLARMIAGFIGLFIAALVLFFILQWKM